MFMKKGSYLFLASSMLASTIAATVNVPGGMVAQAEGTIGNEENSTIQFRTTLQDGMVTSSENLSFSIWAKDTKNNSLLYSSEFSVTLNEQNIKETYAQSNDKEFRYNIQLKAGKNTIKIVVKNGEEVLEKTYVVNKEEKITDETQDVVFSIETFVLGKGYIIEPKRFSITNESTYDAYYSPQVIR